MPCSLQDNYLERAVLSQDLYSSFISAASLQRKFINPVKSEIQKKMKNKVDEMKNNRYIHILCALLAKLKACCINTCGTAKKRNHAWYPGLQKQREHI